MQSPANDKTYGHQLATDKGVPLFLAYIKRFKSKDGPPLVRRWLEGIVDIRGKRRMNDALIRHRRQVQIMPNGKGNEAKLKYGAHALMENRNGLCADLRVGKAIQT